MNKQRLDKELLERGMVQSRSQAETYIRMGYVAVGDKVASKPGQLVNENDAIKLRSKHIYVSRAGNKLASVSERLKIEYKNKVMLDVGSSTGGFTDYALRQGASKVIAVDVGTNQLHPSLRDNSKIELHEKTDIRYFTTKHHIDLVVIDVSFISLRNILPAVSLLVSRKTMIVAMVKPQFESSGPDQHKGVIKNEKLRRQILQDFENWAKQYFFIADKADSEVSGTKGNTERFYVLKKL